MCDKEIRNSLIHKTYTRTSTNTGCLTMTLEVVKTVNRGRKCLRKLSLTSLELLT